MKNKKRHIKKYHKYFPLLITLLILLMSVGYALINSVTLDVKGESIAKSNAGVYISEISYSSNVNANINNSEIINVQKTLINSYIELSKTKPLSSITYTITLYNGGSKEQYYWGSSFDENFYDNKNITYKINNINIGDKIPSKTSKEISITYYYKDNKIPTSTDTNYIDTYNILSSYVNLEFKEYNVEFTNTGTYSIYSSSHTIPVVVSNNNDYDISGTVIFNNTNITDSITIKANTKLQLIPIDISNIYSSLTNETIYTLSFKTSSPIEYNHNQIIAFTKNKAMVDITNIDTYINGELVSNPTTLYNTEDSVIFNNNMKNTKYSYVITMRNNSSTNSYKMRNINELINSNSNYSYTSSINLADGIILKPNRELTFTLEYDYTVSNNNHLQILNFEFKWQYTFAAVADQVISISTPETNTGTQYGDFEVVTADSTFYNDYCTYKGCYSGNNGNLEYDELNGLVLDADNPILTLTIDQSMSVKDEYTLYITLKADTSQHGIPAGSFPGTVIAISEANTKYLNWFGFYKDYLHIYSYYNGTAKGNIAKEQKNSGFISFNVSKYSNKTINLQIVATRELETKIYINGTYLTSFTSGTTPVDYKFATIGDLRTGRGLKFTGTIYDLALYNKALTEEEVNTNWLYAQEKWGITE